MSTSETLLAVEGLTKSYGGVHAVRGVSFALAAGEILALIGPNGAGKSTCFDMLNGQNIPDAGRIRLLGEDTTGKLPRAIWRLGVGRTFQITATFPTMTVRENVQVALVSHGGHLFNFFAATQNFAREQAKYERADFAISNKRAIRRFDVVPELQLTGNIWWYPTNGVQLRLGYDAMSFFNTYATEQPVDFNYSSVDPGWQKTTRYLTGFNAGIGFIF